MQGSQVHLVTCGLLLESQVAVVWHLESHRSRPNVLALSSRTEVVSAFPLSFLPFFGEGLLIIDQHLNILCPVFDNFQLVVKGLGFFIDAGFKMLRVYVLEFLYDG